MRRLITLILVVLLTVIVWPMADVRVATAQGGLDLDGYCRSKGFSGAVLVENTAYGWRCQNADGSIADMNLVEVCAWQYGDSFPVPRFSDFNNPNSWLCYPADQPQPGPTNPDMCGVVILRDSSRELRLVQDVAKLSEYDFGDKNLTIEVQNGYRATTFDDENFTGYQRVFDSNSSGGLGGNTSSIRIEKISTCTPIQTSNPSPNGGSNPPVPPQPGRVEATTRVQFRSEPRIGNNVIDTIAPGTAYDLLGKNGNGLWLNISVNARSGWVCASYMRGDTSSAQVTDSSTFDCSGNTSSPPVEPSLPEPQCPGPIASGLTSAPNQDFVQVSTNVTCLRLRVGAGTTYAVKGHVVAGHYYKLLGLLGFWAKVSTDIGDGWMSTDDGNAEVHYIAPNPPPSGCVPQNFCVRLEDGTNERWWADSAVKGKCPGQQDTDWIVTYNTDNDAWKNADISRIRFGAPRANLVRLHADQVAAIDIQPPSIVLCVTNFKGTLPQYFALQTWVWLEK